MRLFFSRRRSYLLALLMMPPPVHGAANINKKMVDCLEAYGIDVDVLNTVPSDYARFFSTFIWRFLRFFVFIKILFLLAFRIFFLPRCVYIGISGGFGLIIDCFFALILRFFRVPVYVHHHSFSYVNKSSVLFRVFCHLLNNCPVIHIVLCSEMGDELHARYSNLVSLKQIHVLSNAAFFSGELNVAVAENPSGILRLGYIANITAEKGIYEVFALFRACRQINLPVKMIVAGPCSDSAVLRELEAFCGDSEEFLYLGAVYGVSKHEFYQSIDFLVFPTRYANEAEPLVIYEAAEQGVPTIANGRGCIASMVSRCGGWAVKDEALFVDEALRILSSLQMSDTINEIRFRALAGSDYLRGASRGALDELLEKMRADCGSAA